MSGMENETVWINEGFVLNDAGHLIQTTFVDLRKPEDRAPIGSLIRGSERKYALEDGQTIMLSKPARFQEYGEDLIKDTQEGLAKEETVTTTAGTTAEAFKRQQTSDMNEAVELLGARIRTSFRETRTETNTNNESLTFGKEWWIFCTSLEPEEDEWHEWRSTLPREYDHVSEIGQPAKFAQALARMVSEQIGPQGQDGWLRDTTEGAETEGTKHRNQMVLHGPVVYVHSVYDALEAHTDNRARMAAFIFTKSKKYAAQREYRFAVLNEGAKEETIVLHISGMMRDALGPSERGLIRTPAAPLRSVENQPISNPQKEYATQRLTSKTKTRNVKSAEREVHRWETRNPDGSLIDSDSVIRESVKEELETQRYDFRDGRTEATIPTDRGPASLPETPKISAPSEDSGIIDMPYNDEDAVLELAQEEFERDEENSEDEHLAIPIRTGSGRVYKSFEEMLSDPSYPMTPFSETWQEKSSTAEEIIQAYKSVDVLDMKMAHVQDQLRPDVASAGWYAMLCIRNIYSKLGDIVAKVWIERERFVVIRLKDSKELSATGRIVIAPGGAYAYCLHLPNKENMGYGGMEWGTKFFPMGSQLETFEEYGWPKKMI